MAAMVLVNNPGTWNHVYGPLRHAHWNGWTPTDLVFPSFVFIVGVSLALAFDRRLSEGHRRIDLFVHALRRSLTLFALGMVLSGWPDLRLVGPYLLLIAGLQFSWPHKAPGGQGPPARRAARIIITALLVLGAVAYFATDFHYFQDKNLRVAGVLQRIAVCYLLASSVVLVSGLTGRVLVILGLLVGYVVILHAFAAPPGYVAPVGGPDGLLHDWIDSRVVGAHVFNERPDPEGLLSTIPALATTLLGVLAGCWLRSAREPLAKLSGLLLSGTLLLALAVALDACIPINKKIWSSSYVLFAAGVGLCALGWCFWVVDIKGLRRWAVPFLVFGTNAIVAYVASTLLNNTFKKIIWTASDGTEVVLRKWLYEHLFAPWSSPLHSSLLYAITYLLLWLILLTPLFRRRVFIRV